MQEILTPVIVLGIMGAVFAGALGVASQVFHVEIDPLESNIRAVLPGANCGACGFAGCDQYANAVASKGAPTNMCSVGGPNVAEQIALLKGVDNEMAAREVATVLCSGDCFATKKTFDYEGKPDCRTLNLLGGDKSCAYGCLGCGTCKDQCEFGAISIVNGIAKIDKEKCVACKKCIPVCPRNIIRLTPYEASAHIYCSSQDFGKAAKENCSVGCVGCSLCTKLAPESFEMEGKLARVKYDSFDLEKARAAAAKCPAKCIIIHEDNTVSIEEEKVLETV